MIKRSNVYNLPIIIVNKKNKKRRRTRLIVTSFVLLFLVLIDLLIVVYLNRRENLVRDNDVFIKDVEIVNYNKDNVSINIIPSANQKECAITRNIGDKLIFNDLKNDNCSAEISVNQHYVYFKNDEGIVSKPIRIDDLLVNYQIDDIYYIPHGYKVNINNIVTIGKPKIKLIDESNLLIIDDLSFYGTKNGLTTLKLYVNEKFYKEIKVIVTDVIVDRPTKFNKEKEVLTCKKYTNEEAELLDEILEYKVKNAGYGTRAGVVEAARFLTLDFPYKISYYFENGRISKTGTHYVDGEGRYYKKGLYLSESKYDDIKASLLGPKMWGCPMKSFEDDEANGYIPGKKYPNGLDCSGFVTWALFNGGFDVGDRGAGENSGSIFDLTDLGDFQRITDSIIKNDRIKVGDLFNYYGHIAILVGKDNNNYYVAESLNTWKAVVINTYPKNKIMKTFKYVVFMDDVYKEDGNITDMW